MSAAASATIGSFIYTQALNVQLGVGLGVGFGVCTIVFLVGWIFQKPIVVSREEVALDGGA